ncbi:hypothetical protein P8452_21700 [Trifolium repens]|nr:hypothetical protein P8452_21700 [Trifolium repens]
MFSFPVSSGNYGSVWALFINCQKSTIYDKLLVHGLSPSNYLDPQPRDCIISSQEQNLDTRKFSANLLNKLSISWRSLIGDNEHFWRLE